MTIMLTSSAFETSSPIPAQHTADGTDLSPPLQWSGVPGEAKEMAMIVDDPDAPREHPFVHWVIYGIPADAQELSEAVPKEREVAGPVGATQGVNDFGKLGYGGPAPPEGHGVHHYHFKLYALNENLSLAPGLTKPQLLEAIEGKIIDQGELIGTYAR